MKLLIALLILALPVIGFGQEPGSAAYCSQLAEIGGKAYDAKVGGISLSQVLDQIGYVLESQPEKRRMAQSVVAIIYGDDSISSSKQAYDAVYSTCKR